MTQYPQDPNQPFQPQWQPTPPQHQAPKKKHTARNIFLAWGAVILGGAVLIGIFAPSEPAKQAADKLPNVVTTTSATTAPPAPKVTPTQPPKTTAPVVEPTVEVTTEKPSMTASQEQAVGTAEDYLRGQSFSRKGLIEQLVYEGFSTKDATFGVDQLTVDWGSQAAEVARNYLSGQHFSRTGLIEQLEYEGFTHKQAVYGVSKAGL